MSDTSAIFRRTASLRWFDLAIALVLLAAVPGVVLLISLNQARQMDQERVDATSARIVETVERRVQLYTQVLLGARGLVAASQDVELSEWQAYAESIIHGQISVVRGLGWAPLVRDQDLAALEANTRANGSPGFTIRAAKGHDLRFPVVSIYPSTLGSRLAGVCLDEDPDAAAAIAACTATHKRALSGPVAAAGDDSTVLLMLPVMTSHGRKESAQAAILGIVFTPLDVNALIADLRASIPDVDHIAIADGAVHLAGDFDDESGCGNSATSVIKVADRTWTVRAHACHQGNGLATAMPWILAAASAGLGILAMLLVRQLRNRQEQARLLAERMTVNLRQTQRELRTALEAAQEAAQTKDDFLAVMSHELRTPLNGVIGMTNLLLDTKLTSEQHDFAETTRSCANSLLEVINDILDYSKLEAGKVVVEDIPFDPRDLLEEVLQVVASRVQVKGLELVGEVDPRLGERLTGDPSRLRQLLLNLLANAIKFTEHGEVTVSVRLARDDASRPLVRFAVRDTGIGIAADKLPMLFQPFTQADGSISRRFGGTGLGLAISKRLTEAMGGNISASSTLEVGSEFVAILPLGRHEGSESSAPPAELTGRLALLIDDHPVARAGVAAILGDYGCEVVASGSLEQGRALLGSSLPDLIVADAAHTDDPAAIASLVRGGADAVEVPTILLTGFGIQPHQLPPRCATVGKPVRRRQLRDACASVLGGRAGSGTSRIPRRFPGTRVLVADARLGNLRIMAALLAELGCRCDLVTDEAEALAAVARVPYTLVLIASDLAADGASALAARLRPAGVRGLLVACGGADRSTPAGCDAWAPAPPRASDLSRLLIGAVDKPE